MTFKATLSKYRNLGLKSLMRLNVWAGQQLVEPELTDPTLLVGEAKNEAGETVAFCTVVPVLFVSSFVVNPTITPEEQERCGDFIRVAVEDEAKLRGISKILLATPKGYKPSDGGKIVSTIVELPVSRPSNLALAGLFPEEPLSHYIN